jgi:uncharacterized membrane protein
MDASNVLPSQGRVTRTLRHLGTGALRVQRRFDEKTMERISAAIAQAELGHAGEIRFAVEASLSLRALLAGVDTRTRALTLFSHLRLWDTEANTGVLLYLLWADKAIEIVVDRGIVALVPAPTWDALCAELRERLRNGDDAGEAVCACIAAIGAQLGAALPSAESTPDELPNMPLLL